MRSLLLLLFVLWQPWPVAAAPENALQQLVSEGTAQFREGRLGQARKLFEQASERGLQSPSLHYNLGVVCYQLGDYDAASQWFARLLNGRDQALASYNLGLVALADERPDDAARWFRSILEAADEAPEKVLGLAERQLADLGEGPERASVQGGLSPQGYLSLGGGYDSNLSSTPEASASNDGGVYAELIAAGSLNYSLGRERWLTLDLVGFARRYAEDEDYDQQLLQLKLGGMQSWRRWIFGIRPVVSQSWLLGEQLETRWGGEWLARSQECLPGSDWGCDLRVSVEQIDGGKGYEAYDGQWYQGQLGLRRRFGVLELGARYRLELNDRQDLSEPEGFVSVSPTRHEWMLDARYRLKPGLVVGAEATLRHSRYGKPHVWIDPDSGEQVERRREDDLKSVGVMAELSLGQRWLVRQQWVFQHQDSRLRVYDYRRHGLVLSLEGVF
ncbi:tetratricopeptide repeat protein [Marinobacter daepoensis]|uniref:tetratricopeptide repeat protein n=1 Tax=Marinobacter daepoensis TaxID=262077 RepID=UPI001C93A156|nr:tetratricopeptide repeat protein [Marinobacter daepoensis]MBY6033093.1 tetratricopeptide repeat protein [Marinobacter daepoensis]